MVAAVVVPAVVGLAGCGSGAATSKAAPSQCKPGTGLTQTASTHSYAMVLNVGPSEPMYTQAQVAAQHVMTGEIMLRGQMTDMSGAGTGSSASTMMVPTSMAMGAGSMSTSTMPMGQTTVTAMGGSGTASAIRHLEVHICSASTGQAVQDAQPTMAIVDHSSAGMTDQVPIAVMEGVGQGAADLHYGNNVALPAGHAYTLTVGLNGDTATFNFTGPS